MTMNFGWVRSCNVAEEAQSAGSHHVGDWLALCHLPDLHICYTLRVRNAEDLPISLLQVTICGNMITQEKRVVKKQ